MAGNCTALPVTKRHRHACVGGQVLKSLQYSIEQYSASLYRRARHCGIVLTVQCQRHSLSQCNASFSVPC